MIRCSKTFRFVLYTLGILASLGSIPLGNAIKDLGIIHTLGIVIALFVAAGLYWDFRGKNKKPDIRKS